MRNRILGILLFYFMGCFGAYADPASQPTPKANAQQTVSAGALVQNNSQSIEMVDSPTDNGKEVMTIAAKHDVLTILQQGTWLKVADPQSGNVGWIKQADVNQIVVGINGIVNHYVITQNSKDGKSQQVYQVTEIGNSQAIDQQHLQQYVNQWTQQQQKIQQSMNQMMATMLQNFNDLQNAFWQNMPTVVVVQQNQQNSANTKNNQTKSTSNNQEDAQNAK